MDELSKERIAELAWLAGIVDGEGHIGLHRKKSAKRHTDGTLGKAWLGYAPALVIAMNSELVCRRAYEITAVGHWGLKGILNNKEHWHWRARNQQAAVALRMLEPFLVEKKHQAQLVIRATEINANYQSERKWRERLPERAGQLEDIANELHVLHGTGHKTLSLN